MRKNNAIKITSRKFDEYSLMFWKFIISISVAMAIAVACCLLLNI